MGSEMRLLLTFLTVSPISPSFSQLYTRIYYKEGKNSAIGIGKLIIGLTMSIDVRETINQSEAQLFVPSSIKWIGTKSYEKISQEGETVI